MYNNKISGAGSEVVNVKWVKGRYLPLDGSVLMTGNINMDNNRIYNLAQPSSDDQPTPRVYVENNYLNKSTVVMAGNLNMSQNKITHLLTGTQDTDGVNKKYIDDGLITKADKSELNNFLKRDGTVKLTGDLHANRNKIVDLGNAVNENDAVSKTFLANSHIQPSHYSNQFQFLMNTSQWSEEDVDRNSFNMIRVDDLSAENGNYHTFNHKAIYTSIQKNSQGGYRYKMGASCFPLSKGQDYTLCLEMLNEDYELWHKMTVSVDKTTSQGLTVYSINSKKFSHRYTSNGSVQYMYYVRLIVSFRKTDTDPPFRIDILVNIPQDGIDLQTYPSTWTKNYIIAYGTLGTHTNTDASKTYDFHTAYTIEPTKMTMNVPTDMKNKKIINVADGVDDKDGVNLCRKFISKKCFYEQIFSEFGDFTNPEYFEIKQNRTSCLHIKSRSNTDQNFTCIFVTKHDDSKHLHIQGETSGLITGPIFRVMGDNFKLE